MFASQEEKKNPKNRSENPTRRKAVRKEMVPFKEKPFGAEEFKEMVPLVSRIQRKEEPFGAEEFKEMVFFRSKKSRLVPFKEMVPFKEKNRSS